MAADEAEKKSAAGTFVFAVTWVVALLAVSAVLAHVAPGAHAPVLQAAVRLVLSFAGLYWIAWRRVRTVRPLSAVGFVRRPSQWEELGVGVAVGWGVAVTLVLPALLTGNLHTLLAFDGNHAGQTAEALLLEVLLAVGTATVVNGLIFRSLARATSGTIAVVAVALASGALVLFSPGHDVGEAVFACMASVLFTTAALRTRAIWVSIGLQAGWGIALNVVFGVGSFYWPAVSGVVTSYVTGARWLTGSFTGPETSVWALAVALAGLVCVWRVTRDYAWHYGHDPIVPGGYAMEVAPPKEHTRMEDEATRASAALVQIQGVESISKGN